MVYSFYTRDVRNALQSAESKDELAKILNKLSHYARGVMLQEELQMVKIEAINTAANHPSFSPKDDELFNRIAKHFGIN